jgi:hypothetical protein
MKRPTQTLDETFALLEEAAAAGARCPMSRVNGGTLVSGNVTALAKEGHIAVEVSGRNWRRVTILTGPLKGKSTAPNPDPKRATVYLTIDKTGTRRNGKLIDAGASNRPQPSAPRLLTREELA